MSDRLPSRILWMDFETTGIHKDSLILEVALAITDSKYNTLSTKHIVVPLLLNTILTNIQDYIVLKMHTDSGLIEDCITKCRSHPNYFYRDFYLEVVDYIRTWIPSPTKILVGGHNVQYDKDVFYRLQHLYRDTEYPISFSHRSIDSSTLVQMSQLIVGRKIRFDELVGDPNLRYTHRAMDDLLCSLSLVRNISKSLDHYYLHGLDRVQ